MGAWMRENCVKNRLRDNLQVYLSYHKLSLKHKHEAIYEQYNKKLKNKESIYNL